MCSEFETCSYYEAYGLKKHVRINEVWLYKVAIVYRGMVSIMLLGVSLECRQYGAYDLLEEEETRVNSSS